MEMTVIGAGVTGLAAGLDSGASVLEQRDGPGGICRSYYVRPGESVTRGKAPDADDAYRFEVGGGHWIFGGDSTVLEFMEHLAPMRVYTRRASVRLNRLDITVPYPLQAHTHLLGAAAQRIAHEQAALADQPRDRGTLQAWLEQSFGATLCDVFFTPFHHRYTAGLSDLVAPQDGYKSPSVRPPAEAATKAPAKAGYNATFRYPTGGLDVLAAAMAERCDVRYNQTVVGIDGGRRALQLADGSEQPYETLVSTLPLHRAVDMAGIDVGVAPDPFTSVLVLNMGAERGPSCPDVHWQYEPDSRSGFFRLGFYSNVDSSFLPERHRVANTAVALYVERAFRGGEAPSEQEIAAYCDSVVAELQGRGYIGSTHVVDRSWVDVAYTWHIPGSDWRERAIMALADEGIHQVGRYGMWHFQGIADSIRDGLALNKRLHLLHAAADRR